MRKFAVLIVTAGAALGPASTWAADQDEARRLGDMSIEELMNESVTSVSKKETSLSRSPASIAVITQDDVRRIGITNLPEALRLVPGVQVARVNSHVWAVSARGFGGVYADKLLVMIDGRSIYDLSFAGVNWDAQDILLEDLDRIEVIRGPGATLWGVNAVNGVINIITKSAHNTHGLMASAAVGTEDRPNTALRYGGATTAFDYRIFFKRYERNGLVDSGGQSIRDDDTGWHAGFRVDSSASQKDNWTVQGDLQAESLDVDRKQVLSAAPYSRNISVANRNHSGNILGRWTHTVSEQSEWSVQASYAHSNHAVEIVSNVGDSADFEIQNRIAWTPRNDVVWGLGYRWGHDSLPPDLNRHFNPQSFTTQLYTAFVQDEIALSPQRWQLTLGSKFEHTEQTGLEIQPNVRLLFTPSQQQTIWAAASRAVRVPDRFERGGYTTLAAFPAGGRVSTLTLQGKPDLKSETLVAYELGYRFEPAANLSLELAGYYNDYDRLIEFTSGATQLAPAPQPGALPLTVFPRTAANGSGGHSYGAEFTAQWQATERWRLAAGYSWLHLDFLKNSIEFASPEHQARVHSYFTLPWNLEFNPAAFYVDRLSNYGIPSYVRLDAGLVSHLSHGLELGVWGQNLSDKRHVEFQPVSGPPLTYVPRSFSAKLTWRF